MNKKTELSKPIEVKDYDANMPELLKRYLKQIEQKEERLKKQSTKTINELNEYFIQFDENDKEVQKQITQMIKKVEYKQMERATLTEKRQIPESLQKFITQLEEDEKIAGRETDPIKKQENLKNYFDKIDKMINFYKQN